MTDYLTRAVTRTGNVRGLACVTTSLVQNACRMHDTCPTTAAALGRALTGGVLMGALLKSEQRVALKFEGNGPLKKMIVEADSAGRVRGYAANPRVDLPLIQGNLDVAGALGKAGFLTVIKDLGMKEPYQGVVQLYTSEIGEDIAYYLTESEQIPSAVGLGVFLEPQAGVTAAGGFLIQTLPPADASFIDDLIGQIRQLPPVSKMILKGDGPEGILWRIFKNIPFDVLGKTELSLKCSCSRRRMEQALLSLGPDEIKSIRLEQKQADITCEFCRTAFTFSEADLKRLESESGGCGEKKR